MNEIAQKLVVLGDTQRIKVLCYLNMHIHASVTELAEHMQVSIAVASHHLQVLKSHEFVVCEKEGKCNRYMVAKNSFMNDIKKLLCKHIGARVI